MKRVNSSMQHAYAMAWSKVSQFFIFDYRNDPVARLHCKYDGGHQSDTGTACGSNRACCKCSSNRASGCRLREPASLGPVLPENEPADMGDMGNMAAMEAADAMLASFDPWCGG